MTTAPDLPFQAAPAELPYPDAEPATAPYPALALVPAQDGGAVDLRDVAAFDDALRRAMPRLRRYASRRLLDQHEAEEVVQEALLRAFQHREQLATEDDLMAWLTVVTGRLTIDRLRVRGRSTPVAELPAGSRSGRDTAEVVVAREEARIALDALEAMPARQASVLWAREVEGLSYDDICDRFALTEPPVRSLLHRARRTLRREYSERGGTLPTMGLVALAPWLRGLRFAGRVRDIAKRGGGAAAIAATGLAITAVAPLWAHTPAPAHAATPMHGYVAKAQQVSAPVPAHRVAAATKPVVHAATTGSNPAPATTPHRHGPKMPVVCAYHGGAGCTKPTDILYVNLPNGKAVGVSVDVVKCAQLPTTPVTACKPKDDHS
ncbi:MAG: RNA polymerase sigma factor [Frankiaceae bacterium]|nr:RNA polymerase sigma factor [Frankiaceae bacterium]MBV9368275.1 RNA polymerase sigma factor [Frankiales bacterium]